MRERLVQRQPRKHQRTCWGGADLHLVSCTMLRESIALVRGGCPSLGSLARCPRSSRTCYSRMVKCHVGVSGVAVAPICNQSDLLHVVIAPVALKSRSTFLSRLHPIDVKIWIESRPGTSLRPLMTSIQIEEGRVPLGSQTHMYPTITSADTFGAFGNSAVIVSLECSHVGGEA